MKMVEKAAVTCVEECHTQEGFVSRLFPVPKKEGQMRPVINLNRFLATTTSKWKVSRLCKIFFDRCNDWMTKYASKMPISRFQLSPKVFEIQVVKKTPIHMHACFSAWPRLRGY